MTGSPVCPTQRKSRRPDDDGGGPAVSLEAGVWRVRSFPLTREVLRASEATTQAGFQAETARIRGGRQPVLYLDGEEHRRQRAAIGRYFAPKTVTSAYREFMNTRADELVAAIARRGVVDLPEVTMRYSVEVAAQVIGLADADMRGLARRLERFFTMPSSSPGNSLLRRVLGRARGSFVMWRFFTADVRPAIRARRANPASDVISHLIAEGYSDADILIECLTYGAAGMVTTREFIGMAAWHLLERPALRDEFLAADSSRRRGILGELLRLEPVVGHLYRRTTAPLSLVCDGESHEIPAGALVDLDIRSTNADAEHVGEEPLCLRPGRALPARTPSEVSSFGDGAHRCPGNHIAMEESDAFLTRLLALPLRIEGTPRVEWDDLISAYEVRGLRLRVTGGAGPRPPSHAQDASRVLP